MFAHLHKFTVTLILTLICLCAADAHAKAIIDNKLTQKFTQIPTGSLIPVVVTYQNAPNSADIQILHNLGIQYGVTLSQLPMAGIWATKPQIDQLSTQSNIRSIYLSNDLKYFNKEGSA